MNHLGDTNKMVSDTPRTDAHIEDLRREPEVSGCDRTLNFCRQLERELNEANHRIKRLEEAGDELLWAFCPASVSMMTERESDALKLWIKAKEAKL